MRQPDSGRNDLVAINRAARAARRRDALAQDTPSAAALSFDLSGVAGLPSAISSSRRRGRPWMIAAGSVIAVLVIAVGASMSVGRAGDTKGAKASTATATALQTSPPLPARVSFVPVQNALPDAPLVNSAATGDRPMIPVVAPRTSVAAAAAEAPAAEPATKLHRKAGKKPQRKGPKLTKATRPPVTR